MDGISATPGATTIAPEDLLLAEAASLAHESWTLLTDTEAAVRLQKIEEISRLLDAAKIHGAAEVGSRTLAGRYDHTGAANPRMLLVTMLHISPGEASRRLAVATATHPVTDPISQTTTDTRQPLLARALDHGEVSLDQAATLMRHVDQAQHLEHGGRIPTGTAAALEEALTDIGAHNAPDYLNKCAERALNNLDPDGNQPTDGELLANEGIVFARPRRGMVGFRGHMTVLDYEEFITATGTATNPRATTKNSHGTSGSQAMGASIGTPDRAGTSSASGTASGASGETGAFLDGQAPAFDSDGEPSLDRRTRGQKLLHGLLDIVRNATHAGTLPDNGGLRPQLIVTMNLTDLITGLGNAGVPNSGDIPITSIRKAACDAEIIPILLGGDSEVLDVGRSMRIIPDTLRKALHARDRGCTFPDCDRPPTWTEAHHIIPWSEGGLTSLENSCLLCSHHHHVIHRQNWKIELRYGTVYFTPPVTSDYQQRPRRNKYHHPQDLLNPSA